MLEYIPQMPPFDAFEKKNATGEIGILRSCLEYPPLKQRRHDPYQVVVIWPQS